MIPKTHDIMVNFLFPLSFHVVLPQIPGLFWKSVSGLGPLYQAAEPPCWLPSSAPPWKAATDPCWCVLCTTSGNTSSRAFPGSASTISLCPYPLFVSPVISSPAWMDSTVPVMNSFGKSLWRDWQHHTHQKDHSGCTVASCTRGEAASSMVHCLASPNMSGCISEGTQRRKSSFWNLFFLT